MPPSGKLKDAQIAVLEKWVKLGAPDPREVAPMGVAGDAANLEAGRRHWAYQPPVRARAAGREAERSGRGATSIGSSWRRWRRRGCGPPSMRTASAGPAALLRPDRPAADAGADRRVRATAIRDPQSAYREAGRSSCWRRRTSASAGAGTGWTSPATASRSRCAASSSRRRGATATTSSTPSTATCRSTASSSEQIAGDLLPADDAGRARQRQLVATTFLVLGNTNLEEQDKKQLRMDVVDEQLDAIGKALPGPDDRLRPLPRPQVRPDPDARTTTPWPASCATPRRWSTRTCRSGSRCRCRRSPSRKQELKAARDAGRGAGEARSRPPRRKRRSWPMQPARRPRVADVLAVGRRAGHRGRRRARPRRSASGSTRSTRQALHRRRLPARRERGARARRRSPSSRSCPSPGRYEVRLAYSPARAAPTKVPVTVFSADGEKTSTVNQQQAPPIDGRFVSLGEYRFEKNGRASCIVSNEGTSGHVTADAVQFLPVDGDDGREAASGATRQAGAAPQADELKQEIKRMEDGAEEAAARRARSGRWSMSRASRRGKIEDVPIHIRGSVHNLGPSRPRAASCRWPRRRAAGHSRRRERPPAAGRVARQPGQPADGARDGQPRLALAVRRRPGPHRRQLRHHRRDAVAPRAARPPGGAVRGGGLVGQEAGPRARAVAHVSAGVERGGRGPQGRPGEPPARRTRTAGGWRPRPSATRCWRSAASSTTGAAGRRSRRAWPPTTATSTTEPCRSVYVPVFRNSLPEMFEVFDFADPSMVTGRRNVSTVAPQALFLMNHPFVMEQARLAAARLLEGAAGR